MSIFNDSDEDIDDGIISLYDLESDDDRVDDHDDWGDEFDDMDSESWDREYGDSEEVLEGDPWDLN
ncbi:hypothetical protein EXM22_15675 [Oceanispirochaeta crateris]|uniref:Uncharacterized protein n=1 Tax=Oceanispirochaeta crateris TaxID=2518645 RepID=A0A5C1QMM6_9SPIO|nr:hypothetical protein [Oceanispirochaeta crateris]QEN09345.1 hypothetical protein EXM22_15675 [Oceanispirochaeta crateris]